MARQIQAVGQSGFAAGGTIATAGVGGGAGIQPVFVMAPPTGTVPVTPTSTKTVATTRKPSLHHQAKPIYLLAFGLVALGLFSKEL